MTGCSHTGKTALAQRMLEKYKYPYLSLDHLKMGLIRSGQTLLTPEDDEELTPYIWSIAKEIVKTAIENEQNLIVEGCYIPFDWEKDFTADYLKYISYYCLIMTENYIKNHYNQIIKYENVIEKRCDFDFTKEQLIEENSHNLQMCKKYNCNYVLIDNKYEIDINLRR